jgi:hypothetical protein
MAPWALLSAGGRFFPEKRDPLSADDVLDEDLLHAVDGRGPVAVLDRARRRRREPRVG